jgi:hypothetical protein
MIIHDVAQGTPEWLSLRLGIPTASEFHKIITPAKGDLSKSARKYAHYLVAEAVLREPLESLDHLQWIERGKLLEPQAVQQYEFTYDVETRAVGFITTDDGRMGCSPDRLVVGQRRGVEIKCPAPQTHIGYLLDGMDTDYKPQVQGQLLVAELEIIDLYSFHPAMPPVLISTERDEPYIAKMRTALDDFCDMVAEMVQRARASGFFDERPRVVTPAEAAYAEMPDLTLRTVQRG